MKRVTCSSRIDQNRMREILEKWVAVPEESISLVEDINGRNEQTYQDILYVYTGYNDFDTYMLDNTDQFE